MIYATYGIDTGMIYDETFSDMSSTEVTTQFSIDSLLSNWFFIGGVSGGVLLLSIAIGILLAKAKIKKGFDIYEE